MTILVNHVFIQDAEHPEPACTRCGTLKSRISNSYLQLSAYRPLEEQITAIRTIYESVCAGPGSADW